MSITSSDKQETALEIKYNTILFDLHSGIGHIIINQPPGNMMTVEFFLELADLVDRLKRLEELKAIVISGEGRHFSSGAKLDELLEMVTENGGSKENNEPAKLNGFLERNFEMFRFFETVNIPVIAAIRGACLGSALEFALFSHFRFCGEDAVFGLPETTFNLLPGIGGISRIAQLTGKSKALEILLRGNTFPAEEALRLGVVDRILPRKKVVDTALNFAGTVMNDYRRGKEKLMIQRVAC
jgi:enoyl-CoA hydratase/carnithine racemase